FRFQISDFRFQKQHTSNRCSTSDIRQPFCHTMAMKLLYDLLPVILFFLAYKFYGALPEGWVFAAAGWLPVALEPGNPGHAIYLATAVAMAVMAVQLAAGLALKRRLEAMPALTGTLILLLGGATLLLHDPVFIL